MSVRGPRGGRGRGRGGGRTMIWEWETYKPSPSVYENLWHVRQAPVAVTPHVSNDCPIPDARTRIIERRQTEDSFERNFYFVEITYLGGQEPTSTWVQSSDNSEKSGTEVETVDVSRILQYVSPRELERFENEQFRIEAEAQAVADREDEEEQIRRRMQKNARAGGGRGRGGHMLDSFGIDPELQTSNTSRGRPKGRGRGRGRGRGSWRGKGGLLSGAMRSLEFVQDEIVDSEPSGTKNHEPPISRDEIAETSSESENDLPGPSSPGLMRSAFITSSALPLSPVQPHRPVSPNPLRRANPEVPDIGTDANSEESEHDSVSSAAMQLQFEDDLGEVAIAVTVSEGSDEGDGHRRKRYKTESMTPQHTLMFPRSSQIEESTSESEDDSVPADPPPTIKGHKNHDASLYTHTTVPASLSAPHERALSVDETPSVSEDDEDDDDDDDDAEEYIVEEIIEHYHDETGRKFYLVKWEGYKDSHDWLPEEDLAGAAELVTDYNEKVRRRKRKEAVQ
ncbi:hypothetical protein C7974DRAFT_194671 [Boeremia exigua]|uniref:uncharacterized protein n=1 Tax=Boeremia exigua TaxID=749465 RepID=UPI001E8D99A8|nr:uncharacterized protein C7974DRAFT_194671 [Boeremia exigua]KAH6629863.1 hypothetical protein C7974DRAFT_194671 [Boeremia exigua]